MAGIAAFKVKIFDDPLTLAKFVVANATTVVSIVTDNSGKFILFYT
jgi:hypothetical protein